MLLSGVPIRGWVTARMFTTALPVITPWTRTKAADA
jgi:hypothetical protein